MNKSRAILSSIVFQVAIALIILDYQFNPLLLQSSCLLAHGSYENNKAVTVVDCIACHHFTLKDLGDQFIGQISVLVPKKGNFQKGLNLESSFDSVQLQNVRKDQFAFNANVFSQKGCSYYECSSLQVLNDFKLREKDNLQLLNKHQIQIENDINFSKANNQFLEINLALGIVNQTDAVKFQSSPIIKKELESLVIRARYSTNLNIDQERSAAILVYQLQTSIYIRFILILVLLLQTDRLLDLMSHFQGFIKVVLFGIISLGFISSNVAIVSSAVAIYLTLSKIYNANAYGIILSLLFLIGGFTLKFEITAIFILIYTIAVSGKKIVTNFGLIQLGTLIGMVSTALLMWDLKWQFYIYITPALLLGALLSTQQQKSNPSVKYDLINVDQQEDVLYKIKRQLAS